MIRPVIEATLFACAILTNPGFLFQKGFGEKFQDLKMLNDLKCKLQKSNDSGLESQELLNKVNQDIAEVERHFKQFEQEFPKKFPGEKMDHQAVSVLEAAVVSKMHQWYARYRVYSQFTHATMRAMCGDLDTATDAFDNSTLIGLTLILLSHLSLVGVTAASGVNALAERYSSLLNELPPVGPITVSHEYPPGVTLECPLGYVEDQVACRNRSAGWIDGHAGWQDLFPGPRRSRRGAFEHAAQGILPEFVEHVRTGRGRSDRCRRHAADVGRFLLEDLGGQDFEVGLGQSDPAMRDRPEGRRAGLIPPSRPALPGGFRSTPRNRRRCSSFDANPAKERDSCSG